jgi:hypothetical protein
MTPIFVFGSNLAGVHGAGAAQEALVNWGAEFHVGRGLTGSAYAIPTKNYEIQTLPLAAIGAFVDEFIDFAAANSDMYFLVTPIGCGLASYSHEEIAPLFARAVDMPNIGLCLTWRKILRSKN